MIEKFIEKIKKDKNVSIVYLWYTHMSPKVKTKEISNAINNHDWKTFKKWLAWQSKEPLEYFPKTAAVFYGNEYVGELFITEQTFELIMDNDYECG